MGRRMSEQVSRVFNFPATTSEMSADDKEQWSWLDRRLYELGVYDMAPSTSKPPGFFINWATVTSLILVVSAIVGLWYFTWQTAQQQGFEKGRQEAERQQLLERLNKTEEELRRTKDLKLIQSGQNAGHDKEK
jgi:hypothetical protein